MFRDGGLGGGGGGGEGRRLMSKSLSEARRQGFSPGTPVSSPPSLV